MGPLAGRWGKSVDIVIFPVEKSPTDRGNCNGVLDSAPRNWRGKYGESAVRRPTPQDLEVQIAL